MSYIFMDESGDLGFDFTKKKTSKFFVITCLFVTNTRAIEKIVKSVFQSFSQQKRKHHPGVLHCSKELPAIRRRVLVDLCKHEVRILSIYLNKTKVYTRLQDEKQVLYNYVTNILLDRIYTGKLIPLDRAIRLIASRRETNKFLNENFKRYLTDQISSRQKLPITIEIRRPGEEKCLQVVDFACWSIFRRREHGDDSYWKIIREKIVEESPLFP